MFNAIILEKYFNDESEINLNKNEIIEFIKNKFSFIEIDNEIFEKYLSHFKIKNRNSNNNNYDLNFNKNLIKYVNTMLGMSINETNLISPKEITKNINTNLNEEINKLQNLDNIIFNCIKSIISFTNKKDFIEIINDYLQKYIFTIKQNIYDSLHKYFKESLSNKQTLNTFLQIKQNTSFEIINNSILKKINEEKNILNQKINSLSNNTNNITTTPQKKSDTLNRSEIKDITLNINKLLSDKSNNILSSESSVKPIPRIDKEEFRGRIPTTQSKNIKFKLPISKTKKNYSEKEIKVLNARKYTKQGSFRIPIFKRLNSDNKSILNTTSNYESVEDLTNSQYDLFSNNGTQDQFLLETTNFITENDEYEFENEENGKIKENVSNFLKKESGKIDKKLSKEKWENEEKNNNEEYDNFDGEFIIKNYKILNNKNNNSNEDSTRLKNNNLNDFCISGSSYNINNFTFGSPIHFVKQKENQINIYSSFNRAINNFYDFKYIANNHKVKKILSQANDINFPFLSADVNIIFNKNKNKKQKVILIISSNNIYVINSSDEMEIIYKANLTKIKSIVTAEKNFNLLYLNFNDEKQIIIETYQRIEILIFLKSIILKNKEIYDKIKYYSSNDFVFKKKNEEEIFHTKKNKLFKLTPNLENAQKVGVLFMYQENFFRGSFTKKLVILSSIGLIYYDDIEKQPKEIIPIIGTSIKFFNINVKEKIYCFKLKTFNDEKYVFGALNKNETFDWIKELNYYKSLYKNKMKEIRKSFSGIDKEDISDDNK